MKPLSTFAPYMPSSELALAMQHRPAAIAPDADPAASAQASQLALTALPSNHPVHHGKTMQARVRTLQADTREAWISAMFSTLGRASLSGMKTSDLRTMPQALNRILDHLRLIPEENATLIVMFEHVSEEMRSLVHDFPDLLLPVHHRPADEPLAIKEVPEHIHEHGGRLGALLRNPDPDEIGHAFIPIKKVLTLVFDGVTNLPEHYRKEARAMITMLSRELGQHQVSHSLAGRIFDLALYSLLLVPAAMGTNSGITDIRTSYATLGVLEEKKTAAVAELDSLDALSPAIAGSDLILSRKDIVRKKIHSLDREKSEAQLTMLLGCGAAFTGFALLALSFMKFIAEGCNQSAKCPAAIDGIGKTAPVFETFAAIGAAVLGIAIQIKSAHLSSAMRSKLERVPAHFSALLPSSANGNRPGDEEQTGFRSLPGREQNYFDMINGKLHKYSRFSRRFEHINMVFVVSSIFNSIANLIETGLIGTLAFGRNLDKPKIIEDIGQVLMGRDIAYIPIGIGMGASSLQFFQGHGALMSLEAAQHRSDAEIDHDLLLLNDLLDPVRGFLLRAHLHEQINECHKLNRLFVKEIKLGFNSRGDIHLTADRAKQALEKKFPAARIARFVHAQLDLKIDYLRHQIDDSSKMVETLMNSAGFDETAIDELASLHRQASKAALLCQQMLIVKDTVEDWKNGKASVDEALLAKCLKLVLEGKIYDPHLHDDEHHHHHLPQKVVGLIKRAIAPLHPRAHIQADDDSQDLEAGTAHNDAAHRHEVPRHRDGQVQADAHVHRHAQEQEHAHDHGHGHGHDHDHGPLTVTGVLAQYLMNDNRRHTKLNKLLVMAQMTSIGMLEEKARREMPDRADHQADRPVADPGLAQAVELSEAYAYLDSTAAHAMEDGNYARALGKYNEVLALARSDGDEELLAEYQIRAQAVRDTVADKARKLIAEMNDSVQAGQAPKADKELLLRLTRFKTEADSLLGDADLAQLNRATRIWLGALQRSPAAIDPALRLPGLNQQENNVRLMKLLLQDGPESIARQAQNFVNQPSLPVTLSQPSDTADNPSAESTSAQTTQQNRQTAARNRHLTRFPVRPSSAATPGSTGS